MSRIVSKLNLNKTPQLADNTSLVFAKNIRLLKDGIIGPDFPIDVATSITGSILGYIVGLNSTIYLFVAEPDARIATNHAKFRPTTPVGGVVTAYSLHIENKVKQADYVCDLNNETVDSFVSNTLIDFFGGRIESNSGPGLIYSDFVTAYPFASTIKVSYSYTLNGNTINETSTIDFPRENKYNIYKYDEVTKILDKVDSAWTWSGGNVHGVCTTNNTGEIILTVCEYFDSNNEDFKYVPIKHINLSHCSENDDETIYTQTPNIPFTNLNIIGNYISPIPNGVYQFFIRYKINENYYTNWFPCSGECFAGTKNITHTIQGSIQYVDTTLNSSESFIFSVEHLLNGEGDTTNYVKNFKEFQIGFIVSHDDSVQARAWKHFPIETAEIYFDYDKEFIKEINIDDLLKSVYELFNVKNVSYFRDKLYISNYIESNFNEDLSENAFDINCELVQEKLDLGNEDTSESITINNKSYPAIDGTSPTLYDVETDSIRLISKTTKDDAFTPQTDSKGLIYKAYYKAYPGLDPDFFFLKAGYDASITNASDSTDYYAVHKVLKTFCMVPTNDDEDFEDIYYYNNQTTTSSNVGQLLYFGPYYKSNYWFTRPLETPDTKVTIHIYGGNENIYVHPLNNDIDWIFCACDGDLGDKTDKGEILGKSSDPDYDVVCLKKGSNYNIRYCYEVDDVNWKDEDECANWNMAEDYASKQILKYIQDNYPKYVLKSITIYSQDNPIEIITTPTGSPSRNIYNIESESSIEITSKDYNDFRGISDKALASLTRVPVNFVDWCNNYVSSHIIDNAGHAYYVDNNDRYYRIDRVEVKYNEYSYSLGENNIQFSSTGGLHGGAVYTITRDFNVSVKKHSTKIYYDAVRPEIDTNTKLKMNIKSLLPFTDYKIYVHYAKKNGVVTNGYQIGNTSFSLKTFVDYSHSVIYPKFTNISIPQGYDCCFFSIEKVGDDIASGFHYRTDGNTRILDCLEIDSMLYPLTDNITILDSYGNVITNKAKYYPSSTTNPAIMLGNAGCIMWTDSDEEDDTHESTSEEISDRLWIKIKNNSETNNTNRLIKLTPYITSDTFEDYTTMNLPGYYCSVCKPIDIPINSGSPEGTPAGFLYVNGSDIYKKYKPSNSSNAVQIKEYDVLLTHEDTFNVYPYYVYSNFNLDYLALFDESYKNVKYKRYVETDETTGVTIETNKQMLFMLDSSTISYIYTLPSMYKDYTRKLYSSKQDNKLFKFDNVIRSSDANTDESYKYIYHFDAIDYYNVPANKGIIINLFAIEKNLYIHCEHSLYKFVGNNTLTARDTEVQLTEADIFDTGISELFDAEHGFAGIKHKHHALVTFNAYIFYDSIANIIYGYFGNNNLVNISETITKILKRDEIKDVRFSNDTNNDRFFVNIIYNDDNNICLSFNFNSKSFVSIHDFDFLESFSSRSDCYFLDNTKRKVYAINNVGEITNYSDLYKLSKLVISDMSYDNTTVENCLDIICNVDYEKIKALNYINWVCSQINKYVEDNNLFVAEEDISKYPGTKLRIYSDQCSTDLIELTDANGVPYEQNNQSLSNPNSYKYPRYNCGIWSLNYFRDVRNIEDIFNYKNSLPSSDDEIAYNAGVTPMYKRGLVESDKSLIYGKYFVVRFIFKNKNFKLENLIFNIQDYEKV